jgi:chaperone required for assembly of F1-ATPase
VTKRFYERARASECAVFLDARSLKTPRGAAFAAPSPALARAIAQEWEAQGESIQPTSMPLTQLAFAAIDGGASARAERIAYVLKFAETDLCCHRAAAPAELVARQAAMWDPLAAWGVEALGAALPVVTGVVAAHVPGEAPAALRTRAHALDDFRLTALAQAAGLSGSALIGFALVEGRLDADAAFGAAALDELWSLERWGEDAEARARLERLRGEVASVAAFIDALSERSSSVIPGSSLRDAPE